jgi:DNA primase
MGKIGPESAKYVVNAHISIEGVVDKPDVIGAIFGQTEGLLGSELELRELQRSGRIGRIEVDTQTKGGKTSGRITLPSSLDKAETAIIGAALEVIQRIGPCNAKLRVDKIEDIRISKRTLIVERAKELLSDLINNVMPDSQELSDEVAYSVRVTEITSYGKEKLAAGPNIANSDEIIIVEGRADVLNLLKYGFKNAIAVNGTSIPKEVAELTKQKTTTVFVDGDRGGDLIVKELFNVGEIDFVAKAPDGKEVEEITSKEIHQALRSKLSAEQFKLVTEKNGSRGKREIRPRTPIKKTSSSVPSNTNRRKKYVSKDEKKKFSEMLDELLGTRGAFILDENLNVLGRVPVSELESTLKSLKSGVYAVVMEGSCNKAIIDSAETARVKLLIAKDSEVKTSRSVEILVSSDL